MATPKDAFDLVSERKEQLRKVFAEFEAKKFSLGRIGTTWKDLEEHFKEIESCLEKTHEAFKDKEKLFEDRKKSVQEELDKRDADVYAKEQASVRRVQSQKDAAIAAILEQKRKLADEKRKWEAEKQRVEAAGNEATSSQKDAGYKKDADRLKTSASSKDTHAAEDRMEREIVDLSTKKGSIQDGKTLTSTKVQKEPRPKLKSVCQNMDADGFRKLILENQKEFKSLQEEVTSALKLCRDPAQLVLKTIEACIDIDKKGNKELSKEDCFACTMLLESLSEVHGDNPVVCDKVKKFAKAFSDKWKAILKLDGQVGFNVVIVGRTFLHFVATFGLSGEYNQDELCEIVAKVARRKQTPVVFRSLGLSDKAPDMIERLIKDSKLVEAVSFASEFSLLDRFPPAPLLKSYLKEAKKAAKALLKNGNNTLAVQNEALQKELAAFKAVATVVKEHNLEEHYTLDYVDKQIETLEKTKVERKRVAVASRTQQPIKKARTDNGSPTGGRSGTPSPGRPLQGINDREQYDVSQIPPRYGALSMPDVKPRPLGEFERRPLGEFDRRVLEDYEWNERRRLGLYDPGYGGSLGHHPSQAPVPYGHPSLGLASLSYRSSVPNGHPEYNYSAFPSLGIGGFKPYL